MTNPNPLEKVIEEKVCTYAKSLGCLVYKFTSPAKRSVPDRLFIMPAAKGVFFIEFKRKGEVPTQAQEVEIAKIRAQGTSVGVIDNVVDGKVFVDHCLRAVDLVKPRAKVFTAKLNPDKVQEILLLNSTGSSVQELADKYCVPYSTIWNVVNRVFWKQVREI